MFIVLKPTLADPTTHRLLQKFGETADSTTGYNVANFLELVKKEFRDPTLKLYAITSGAYRITVNPFLTIRFIAT